MTNYLTLYLKQHPMLSYSLMAPSPKGSQTYSHYFYIYKENIIFILQDPTLKAETSRIKHFLNNDLFKTMRQIKNKS